MWSYPSSLRGPSFRSGSSRCATGPWRSYRRQPSSSKPGEGSGTQYQGWEAIRLGRPLYFLKSAVNSTHVPWIHEQIKYGAEILEDDNVADVLDALPTRVPIPTRELEEAVPF